jgi:hypothetical protein
MKIGTRIINKISKNMENSKEREQNKEEFTPAGSGGKQTTIDPMQRRTGQGENQETRPGAEAESPGNKDTDTPGNPNQGTEAR